MLDRRAIICVYRNRDGIGVCVNYRRFLVMPVFLVAGPYMDVLIGCHEERLDQRESGRNQSKTTHRTDSMHQYVGTLSVKWRLRHRPCLAPGILTIIGLGCKSSERLVPVVSYFVS